jgi:glycosyltransferase involved in cell wall biosynthesis
MPKPVSVAVMMHDLGVELSNQGHKVIVVTPDSTLTVPCKTQKEDNITVLRVKTGRIKGVSKLIRAVNEIKLSSIIWKNAKSFFEENPCDLIIFYSPTIFFAKLVKRLKDLWNCRAYLILRDIFPQWAVDAGIMKKGIAYWYFKRAEHKQYSMANVIGVECPGNLRYFENNGLKNKFNIEVLYNWAKIENKNINTYRDYRKDFGLEGKIVFFYGGNIGAAQGMDNIIALSESLRDYKDIYFLLVGDGTDVSRLKKIIISKGLTNISIYPPISQENYLDAVRQFDVGLISLDTKLKTYNFPGKLLGYMNCSLPVLASINPGNDLKEVLEKSQAGFAHIGWEHDQLMESALKLAKNPALRKQMGENSKKLLLDKFCVSQTVSQILSNKNFIK